MKIFAAFIVLVVLMNSWACGGGGTAYSQELVGTSTRFSLSGGGTTATQPGGLTYVAFRIQLSDSRSTSSTRSVGSVAFSATGLPSSVTTSFSPSHVIPTSSPTEVLISIQTSTSTSDGDYDFTITATGADGYVQTVPSRLTVTTPPPPVELRITLSGPGYALPHLTASETVHFPIRADVTSSNADFQNFNLRAVDLPTGFVATFDPSTITIQNGTASCDFSLTAPSDAVPGTYSFSIELYTDNGMVLSRMIFPDQLIVD